ncbi:hypothetical protein FHL15_008215 [Xylaria flabelliformis]|uniref:DUF6594 domain-containing protein n=1 Tax=Xylaria flabelliformis TaxID=2512241 RepID=A0A553HSS3_9PEZI|nr:hypothetical protein FHL15_008215 [Xylaria flabelliformis]
MPNMLDGELPQLVLLFCTSSVLSGCELVYASPDLLWYMATINRLKTVVSSWISWVYDPKDAILPMQSYNRSRSPEQDIRKVEDYRAGFPRFSALIACHDFFYILRPFRRIRARLLLLKQDKLAILEEQLDKIDADEPSPLFLGASRHDRNESRAAILREIDSCLVDYDSFVERTHHILSLNHASSRDILSLQHWLKGTGCVNRAETSYLKNEKGLISLGSTSDSAMKQLEDWTEDQFIRHYPNFRAVREVFQLP